MLVSRITRRWLPALAILALVRPAPAAEVDQYVPADAEFAVTVNVRQLLDSGLVKKHALGLMKQFLESNPEAQKMLKPLGFDPLSDVTSLTFAGPGGKDKNKGLVIVRGKFNVEKIRARAAEAAKQDEKRLKEVKEGDYTLYETTIEQQGENQKMYVALVDETTLVGGPGKDYVVAALDKKAGKSKGEAKPELRALLEKADASQSVTFVATGTAMKKGAMSGEGEKVDSIVGGFTVADDFKLDVTVASKDEEAAKKISKNLKEMLDQFKGFASMFTADKPQLSPLVEALAGTKIDAKGTNVTVRAEISTDTIEKVLSGKKPDKEEKDK